MLDDVLEQSVDGGLRDAMPHRRVDGRAEGSEGGPVGAFDLELHSWHGERPVFLQALAHTALFYVSVAVTGSLILLFALFNRRKQTLHDMLAGMVMIRRPNRARTGPDPWRR